MECQCGTNTHSPLNKTTNKKDFISSASSKRHDNVLASTHVCKLYHINVNIGSMLLKGISTFPCHRFQSDISVVLVPVSGFLQRVCCYCHLERIRDKGNFARQVLRCQTLCVVGSRLCVLEFESQVTLRQLSLIFFLWNPCDWCQSGDFFTAMEDEDICLYLKFSSRIANQKHLWCVHTAWHRDW